MRRLLAALFTLIVSFGTPATAMAHPTPGSVAFVDLTVDGARIEQDVPVEELERAVKQALYREGESPEQMAVRLQSFLRAYAAKHIVFTSQNGKVRWPTQIQNATGHMADDGPRVRFYFRVHAPPGEASHSVRLHDDLIAHEVVSHYTHVYVRSDWAAGVERSAPELVGAIHAGVFDVEIARRGSFWRGLGSVIKSGMEHIARGSDHLMFVFALLLAAPAAAERGRWSKRRTVRDTVMMLLALVSAFTVGHSATLVLGALGWVTLSPAFVEPVIALSILVTAVHAIRPIFPRRELIVAGGFGLIHGLAFASTLPRQELGGAQTAWTLLGFNAGIELAQIGLLLVIVPWLLLIARTRAFASFRLSFASVTALFATGWLIERVGNLPNPTAIPLTWLEGHAAFVIAGLAAAALIARVALPLEKGAALPLQRLEDRTPG